MILYPALAASECLFRLGRSSFVPLVSGNAEDDGYDVNLKRPQRFGERLAHEGFLGRAFHDYVDAANGNRLQGRARGRDLRAAFLRECFSAKARRACSLRAIPRARRI